jgi:protocatechuate 3,4-dioxygenase beta subunit
MAIPQRRTGGVWDLCSQVGVVSFRTMLPACVPTRSDASAQETSSTLSTSSPTDGQRGERRRHLHDIVLCPCCMHLCTLCRVAVP